jgi:hypothetical protein
MYGGDVPRAGIVTGIGVVNGRPCVIVAYDATEPAEVPPAEPVSSSSMSGPFLGQSLWALWAT